MHDHTSIVLSAGLPVQDELHTYIYGIMKETQEPDKLGLLEEFLIKMDDELIDAICRAAKQFCIEFMDEISDEWREEIEQKMTVQVNEDTPPQEMLKCFYCALIVDAPEDSSRIGYQLSGNCDWEEEHGIEIDILDGKLVYLSEYSGQSPWDDHSDEEWNYAAHIYE